MKVDSHMRKEPSLWSHFTDKYFRQPVAQPFLHRSGIFATAPQFPVEITMPSAVMLEPAKLWSLTATEVLSLIDIGGDIGDAVVGVKRDVEADGVLRELIG